ncbi:MAG TPA: YciI family protein [Polyangia bacterium]
MPSKKYMLLHRSPVQQESPSPTRMQEMYAVWTAWKDKFKDNVVDMGGKLKPSGRVLTALDAVDGPYVEAKEIVGGFMIVAADNYDQAAEMAREMFGMMGPGTRIEIREMAGP